MNTIGDDQERRLATILAADTVGYSRLMDADEAGTYAALRSARSEVIDPKIEEYRGRIVKHTGDGFLAEFPIVQAAVEFAMSLQEEMGRRVEDIPEDRKIKFRIGINLGDVIVDDTGDIFGDGVNVAARLESLGIPGGICISGSVYDSVHKKLDVGFDDLGDQSVKNIPTPVHAFDIRWEGEAGTPDERAAKPTAKPKPVGLIAGGALAAAALIGIVFWQTADGPGNTAAAPASIAVLPFTDMSAAQDQEYFGDGIAEEIINRLVSIDALKVNSRTSAFSFKESNLSIPEIAAELGARYVVEGSVRSSGNQLRVTAQLIEVASDTHLWSETYDRQMDDIFAVQDDISRSITDSLKVQLVDAATPDRPTENLEAYRLYLQGRHLYLLRGASNIEKAIERFVDAVEIDPEFAEAWADLAASTAALPAYSTQYDPETAMVRAGEAVDRALAIDPDLAQAWVSQGYILLWGLNWAGARAALERAVELNPSHDTGWLFRGLSYLYTGFPADAQAMAERAVEIVPQSGMSYGVLGRAHLAQGNLDAARAAIEQAIALGWPLAYGDMALLAARAGDGEGIAEGAGRFISAAGDVHDGKLAIYAQAYVDPTGREAASTLLKAETEKGGGFQPIWGGLLLQDGESFVRSYEATRTAAPWMATMLWDVPFRPMLKQQAVKDFFARRGLVDYWREKGWPDFCRPLGADDFECGE